MNMSYEQTLKAVDDILRTDAGCATPIDYIEQTSWILFLKYLSDLESERSDEATLKGKEYTPLFTDEFKWDNWAVPKNDDGSQDIVNALTGDDLLEFVNLKLMPYLKTFKTDIENSNTLEYKIGEIFSEISNKLQSGYTLRDVLNNIDTLRFLSIEEKHEMSHLYEEKIKDMGNAGRSGGEYYTPRPLIQAIVEKVDPKIGETVYDPAVGSAGFLVEAFKHMSKGKLSVEDVETLQFKTFYGKEKKSLAYIIALMNMILHGVDAPNILHINTLTENVLDVQDSERHDVILANPPFGGKERKEVQQNFPIKSGETAYLFMQHFIKLLKAGGRAGVVIKSTFLSNMDKASISLRKEILETCNLHTILDLPRGIFPGAGVKTVVIFFEKGSSTKKIQYYQLDPKRNFSKENPVKIDDLKEFISLSPTTKSENSWYIDIEDVDNDNFDLSVINPHKKSEDLPSPSDVLKKIKKLETESNNIFKQFENTKYQNINKTDSKIKEYTSLESLSIYISRGITPKYVDKSKTLVINQRCIRDHKIDIENARYHDEKVKSITDDKILKIGDILINSTGVGTLGRVAQVTKTYQFDLTVDSHVTIFRPDTNIISFDYAKWLFIYLEKQIEDMGVGASGQTELRRDDLKNMKVQKPGNSKLQEEVSKKMLNFLQTLEKYMENSEQKLHFGSLLIKSFLNSEFSDE